MTGLKITEDILLEELFRILPESREVLVRAGYEKIRELDIEDVVADKLTLRGFIRLMDIPEEKAGKIIREIQELYNRKLEEM
jgi:hypothetical protein